MHNPQELQRKAQLNIHGVDTNAQTSLNNNNPPKQENEQHWLVRGLATIGNFVNNIVMGAVKSIEGIVDAGAMLVGLFGADVDDFVSYDFTADIFGADEEGEGLLEWSWGRNLADVSYLDNDHIVNQIADGVGGMLPTVALAFVSGGTSLAASAGAKAASIGAKVANVASKVAFVAGAAGNASESALQEGATYGQALGYGALSGAIEAGTEMIGGRLFGSATKLDNTLLGKLAVKTGTDKFISKGVGKAVYSFASEGLEEVVADLLDPVNKRITGVDSEAKVDWAQLPKTFFIGGAVGSILDGVQSGASALIHKDKGGKHFVNVAESLEDIVSSNSAIAYLQENKKVSQENLNKAITRNTERTLNNLESISEELKQMTKEQRAKAFETINSPFINSMFEENGSLKEGVLDSYSEVLRNGAKYNVSSNLLYENNQVEKDIIKINEQYNANYEISDTELNQKQRQEFAKINRNVSRISKKSGVDFEFVLLKDYVNNNGKKTYAFIDKNRLYVTESGLENGTWAQSLSHEIGHFAENSKEYREYAKYITSDTNLLNSAIDDVVANYFEDYGINAKEGKILVEKVLNGDDKLSKNEKDFYGEVVAHITESLFKSEASITRFTRENTTLAQKILSKIKDLLNMFRGTNAKRDAVVNLRKAEILFERALDSINKEVTEARNKARINIEQYKMDKKEYLALPEAERENWLKDKGYKVEDFADDVLDDGNKLDNSGEIRYSFKGKKTARYINKKLDTPTLSFIRNELRKIYGPIDSAIADGIAIEKDNSIYVVDSGMEDGLIDFGVRQQIKIDDDKLRKERLEKINDRAVSNGFSSSEISGRIKRSPDNGGGSSVQRELQEELSDNTGKSENNESGIFEKDATDGSRRLKLSLKDSDGNELSPEQQEYFKNSKVVDKDGNLLVVYHGTNNEFFVFDKSKIKIDNLGQGFYLVDKKVIAESYAQRRTNERGGEQRVLTCYLNIVKPFDTSNITVDEIKDFLIYDYLNRGRVRYEYRKKFGINQVDAEKYAEEMINDEDIPVENGKKDFSVLFSTNEKNFQSWLKERGYDGLIVPGTDKKTNLNGTAYVVFESNQIKLTANTNPTTSSDIRFSLKGDATYTLSDGQVKKKVANFTKLKVYSKVEAESIINSILETNFNLEDYSVRISGKTKAEAIDVLWKTLNTADAGKRTGISLKIADYIIDNTIIESIYLEEENQIYTETISFLKPYLHSVDLKALKGEIKYRYDTDNSVYLLWGKRKGEGGQTADQIAMELAESGFFIDAENEADIFFEMDRAYREAVRALKKKSDKFLADTLGKEERDKLRQDIAKDILRAFDSNGKKSKLAEIIEQQKERAKVWKDLYYEEKQRNSAINNLLYEVGKIRDIHFGDFQNSTQSHNLLFRGSIERLSAIKHRGDLNKSGTRSIVAGLNEWYSKDNPVVGDRFVEDISYILNKISSGTGKLTAEEIKGLATAVAYFRHFIETNNKIFRAGKYVDAKPIVEDYIKKIAETQNLKISWAGKVFDKLFNNSKLNYMQTFNDPMTIARYMDKYGDGFFTQTLESFREGAVNSAILEMELNASVEEFYDKHKKFLKNLKAKTVKYNNVEIPADKALYLYMALNREQALMGLARSGFSYKDDKGKTVRVAGFETNEDLTLDDIRIIASEVQSELEKQFTEEEIEYIKIAEKLFNEDCKKLKSERDKTRLGYSNVVDDYYIPIRRAYIAQSVDVDSLQFELDRVSNLSFNKSAVKGAKNELFIESLDLVLSRHLRGIAQYYHISNVIDNFNIIYNMDIGGNANRVKSIASESVNVWDKGKTYLQDLISDIQGVKRGEGSRAFGFIRGSYAKYQLGANPKVWFTQLSSFFASTSILDYGSVIKGLAIKTNDVDKYCSLAKLRNNDNTAALAQGVLDKVDKVSNVLMKPIGMTDRLVVKKLFGACQVQVQKNTGLKIGTEENKVKAGELLQKVILETQQNTMATERSQAMRSSSELMKTLTMFTSDSMKVVGRVIDSYGELSILKARRKATTDASEKANLDKQIKTARKKAAKSTSALVTSAIFMALIAQAFRTLYNKDDEEDNIVENMTVDAVGNLFSGLPIFKDVYAKLVEGYDFDGYQYSAINDLLDSMSDVINLTGDIFSGNADSRDIALNIKKMSYAIGQLFGFPVRNVYNVFYGLTNRISPATAYKIDDIFYKQSYNSDLKKAIKNNDEAMIATIAGLIMNENVGDFENGSTRSEVNRLLSAGFDVLPQSVPSSVTINEVQHSLTGPQQEKFRKAHSGAITAVDKLVSSNGYKIATDEAKAKAVKYVYRYYYYEAQHQALNVDLDSKLYLFGQIVPIEKMALALAEVPLLVENSTNKKTAVQRYLQASKLTSAQKYMLMGYFGYKNTKGEGVVKSAINKTSLTKEQKKLLLEKCGY